MFVGTDDKNSSQHVLHVSLSFLEMSKNAFVLTGMVRETRDFKFK